ncbi:MAG: TetR/AcrR family transcriptional regulator [Clostridiaceae bacterium]|nr:TetR/AcrR family transcriptional regulator [Clostridiaceae bacterium]
MEKAEELFIQLGYKSVSMDEIAKAAGVSKMTIYKHFSSKEELFIGIVLSIMEKSMLFLEKQLNNADSTLGKIEVLMKYNREVSGEYSVAFYKDIIETPHIKERVMKEKIKITQEVFEAIIKEGMEKGEMRAVDEKFVANMLISLVEGFGNKQLYDMNSREEMEEVIEKFYDFIKYGLLGREG